MLHLVPKIFLGDLQETQPILQRARNMSQLNHKKTESVVQLLWCIKLYTHLYSPKKNW